ncbi:ATP synthase mitochondrial F1 complex assembly factor 2 [Eupeodes corollae]|uniref:ATP synthase mitochondrial F1 complex assembly factor 2 n=1 Tax=Eupeodes corollae TaxID=290404 RepID=UPI0024931E7E|nr:ATP synthase mitochondrial F1 complex assembly factor 2 [Eupeodes corollae]
MNNSTKFLRPFFYHIKSSHLNVPRRFYAAPKRFYKNTNVLYNDGKYEVTLDHRKLKTPRGNPFLLKSEPLAIAVATEFANQKETIVQSAMHLSALCFTSMDNPNNLTKPEMVNYMLNFLPTDTILYQTEEDKDLYELQKNEWDPVIEWFNKRFDTNIQKTPSISPPTVSDADKMKISKYFLSHSEDVLYGFVFAVDTLKSIILSCAVIEQHISADKAVTLARLEEEFQLKFWGRVEWAHDMNQLELQARLAAAILFVHFNRSEQFVKEKLIV